MKSQERVQLTFTRYRTPAGKPTCCRRWGTRLSCSFLVTTTLGTIESCNYRELTRVFRSDSGLGYLVPHEGCPLWSRKAKKVK